MFPPKIRKYHRVWPVAKPQRKLLPTHLVTGQGTWFWLFHALLGVLILYPYVETFAEKQHPYTLTVLNSAIIITIVYTISFNWIQFLFACALAAPTLVLYWLPDTPNLELLSCAFTILIYSYTILLILPYLLHADEVESEEIYGSAALYILLGLTWANLYQAIEILYPSSFHIPAQYNVDLVVNWSDLLFFSFTTLTTLGYGDIAPVTSQARSLAILEAITGVIFLAVIISRAIGLYVCHYLAVKNGQHHHEESVDHTEIN